MDQCGLTVNLGRGTVRTVSRVCSTVGSIMVENCAVKCLNVPATRQIEFDHSQSLNMANAVRIRHGTRRIMTPNAHSSLAPCATGTSPVARGASQSPHHVYEISAYSSRLRFRPAFMSDTVTQCTVTVHEPQTRNSSSNETISCWTAAHTILPPTQVSLTWTRTATCCCASLVLCAVPLTPSLLFLSPGWRQRRA